MRGVPLAVLDVDAEGADALYPHKLLLARPDQHVAWRGDAVPDDPLVLVDPGLLRRSGPSGARKRFGRGRSGRFATATERPDHDDGGMTVYFPAVLRWGATFRMNSVRLCATSSNAIGPSRNCMITPPTPIAATSASFSATVAGEP